jgi:ABC-type polysaccharide/polyol phosphate export permease
MLPTSTSVRGYSSGLRSLARNANEDLLGGLSKWQLWTRLGWNDVRRRYHRTKIGPFWSTLTLLVYILSVGIVGAGLWGQDIKTYLPFLASGMLVWTFLSILINESCLLFTQGALLFNNARMEYSLLAYALVWKHFLLFLHNMVVYALVVLYSPAVLDWASLLAIPGIVILLVNGVWIALLIGLVCLRFRDVAPLISSAITILMLVTPLFWPADRLPKGLTHLFFVKLNPIYRLIDIVRTPLLGGIPTHASYAAAVGITVCGWLITYWMFRTFRRRISYWS